MLNLELTGARVEIGTSAYSNLTDPIRATADSVMVRLDPYDMEGLEVKWLPETREVIILHHAVAEGSECVYNIFVGEP
jgi:hypothetical protein